MKIPCAEFFIYDFQIKKYNSIGKGDFSVEFSKTDEKKESPLLIFRNAVLKILFQGLFKPGLTKLETVNKNFKTVSVIQKALVINENTKKFEFKSVKILHSNDLESKSLIETFAKLEKENSEKIKIQSVSNPTIKSEDNNKQTESLEKKKDSKEKLIPNTSDIPLQTCKAQTQESKKGEEKINKISEKVTPNNNFINKIEDSSHSSKNEKIGPSIGPSINNSKTNVFPSKDKQLYLSQKEKSSVDKYVSLIPSNSQSKNDNSFMNGNKFIGSKLAIQEKIDNKPIENKIEIISQSNANKLTESKSLEKIKVLKEEDKKNENTNCIKNNEVLEKDNKTPTKSVGKITNVHIKLISSNRSKNKEEIK